MINRFGIRETKMKKNSGFTLIELMIVVAVIGILVAIALPSYNDSVMKARRGEAESALIEAANALERYYTQNGSYTGAVAGTTFSATVPTNGAGTIFYDLTVAINLTGTTFTLTADPTTAQNDPRCENLTLTQTNLKDITGTGTVADCW